MDKKSRPDEIDFHCSLGIWPFRKNLDITPAGFQYCGELFPLNTITRLRWGADLKRRGLFPRTRYAAIFGTKTREVTVKTWQRDLYERITQLFWRAVGRRLMAEMLDGLRRGEEYQFGDFAVADEGISIAHCRFFKDVENKFYKWDQLNWGIVNGSLVFTSAEDMGKPIASASFMFVDNAHILSIALALFQEREKRDKLSSVAE